MSELIKLPEKTSLMDFDQAAWEGLIEMRGGCRCHINPPCSACSDPVEEDELNELGYTLADKK